MSPTSSTVSRSLWWAGNRWDLKPEIRLVPELTQVFPLRRRSRSIRVLFGKPSLHVTLMTQCPGPQMSAEFSGLEFRCISWRERLCCFNFMFLAPWPCQALLQHKAEIHGAWESLFPVSLELQSTTTRVLWAYYMLGSGKGTKRVGQAPVGTGDPSSWKH